MELSSEYSNLIQPFFFSFAWKTARAWEKTDPPNCVMCV